MCIEPPLPARASVDAAEQLGHHGARSHAARERLAVVAVRRDDVVVGAERREHAGAHRLLPDVQVAEAADLAERVRLGAALLEAALEQHRVQQLVIQLGARRRRVAVRATVRGDFFLGIVDDSMSVTSCRP